MKNLGKRVNDLEKFFGSQSEFAHLTDDELDEFIKQQSESCGFRPAKPGEVVEIPEIDRSLFRMEPSAMTDEQLDQLLKYRRAKDGYVSIKGEMLNEES